MQLMIYCFLLFFFEKLSEETTEQEKDSASAPKEEEASTSQDKTENTGIVYKPDWYQIPFCVWNIYCISESLL